LIATWSCGGDEVARAPVQVPQAAEAMERVGSDAEPKVRDDGAARFYGAYLAETLRGDTDGARQGYREVAESDGAAPALLARAALRLAAIEAALGDEASAKERLAQVAAAVSDDLELLDRADRLRQRLGSAGPLAVSRGPVPGTELVGANPEAAEAFARAEAQLSVYYARPLAPRLEGLRRTLRANHAALESVVRTYRMVSVMDPVASVASEFRIAAAYHDSALAMFDVPPELEPRVAAALRHSLKRRALGYLARARDAYRASIEIADSLDGASVAAVNRWRHASETGLAAVTDLLRRQ